jgi:hypothetical protein
MQEDKSPVLVGAIAGAATVIAAYVLSYVFLVYTAKRRKAQ